MKYVGSKSRLSKYIVPILQDIIDKNNIKIYYEPFVGGANVIDKVKCTRKIGNDAHPQLIAMWKAIQNGWEIPLHISEEEYNSVKNNKEKYDPAYVGLVGFCATFGSKYFGGYARGYKNDGTTLRDIPNESLRNLKKQIPNILNVEFICGDYKDLSIESGSLIYCDPPYENTTKYSINNFNYEEFWCWCREKSKDNYVVISELSAPSDFKCIWERTLRKELSINNRKTQVEKLFILEK